MDDNVTQEIKRANKLWRKRVSSLVRDVQYDHEADILYVNYGKITEAFSMPADNHDDCVYLRIDVDTHEIIGIEILSFRETFLESHPEAKELFETLFGFFGRKDWRFQVLPSHGDEEPDVAMFTPASEASVGFFADYLPKIAPDLVPA